MLLVIDAGNTNLTFGLFREQELIQHWRLATERDRSGDEYGADVLRFFESAGIDHRSVDGIAIASVVPQLNAALRRMSHDYFGLTPFFVNHTTEMGLKILYDSPADLGVDRIVDAVAAVTKYGAPCIVVDFGTATTFNVVNGRREYLGGAIAPGIKISAEALFSRAAQLPRVEITKPEKVIGSSTVRAMQSGLYHGYIGLVDGVLEQMIVELGEEPRVIATGGLSVLIARASKFIEIVDDTLTLEGLRIIYKH